MDHPSIVPVSTAGEEAGIADFARELVSGITLAWAGEKLAAMPGRAPKGRDLWQLIPGEHGDEPPAPVAGSWTDAGAWGVAQAARAIHYAHTRHVLHRDINASPARGFPSDAASIKVPESELMERGRMRSPPCRCGGPARNGHRVSPRSS